MVTPVGEHTLTFRGLSTDSKPTADYVGNGSVFIEMDTSKIYLFDKEGNTWHEFTVNTQQL